MKRLRKNLGRLFLLVVAVFLFVLGGILIWAATLKLPDLKSFEERKVARATKIYDRTGETLLYSIHNDIKRTVIPWTELGANIKNATVAVEDAEFYRHAGVRPKSTLRALFMNLKRGNLSAQGGSTITQQVVKNTLLTNKKTVGRKIKEWVLAIRLERSLSKEEILAAYLNEMPYGGNIYGVYEATLTFFNKEPKDLTLSEAAYLAAIPKAPTFYSPYGSHKDKLEERKNFILHRMKELGFITEEDYDTASQEQITFKPAEPVGIKAPHFVFFIKEYLEEKYGKDVDEQGLKVITTLDYNEQKRAEEVVLRYAKENEKNWNASNAAAVAIDPKTGQILVMVGSRDYFDKEIDGNFNVATASRQPGSAFKPFVYVTAFSEGFIPDTVLFDVPTEFAAFCDPYGKPKPGQKGENCYMPKNFDGLYKGPIPLRSALGESRNIPSVKLSYLAGLRDSIKIARDMGITTLADENRYGLTLVLGGGEVKLLEMASAYGVFATNGIRRPYTGILKIEDSNGSVLEEYESNEYEVLPKNPVLTLTDVLADNDARTPLFGPRSFMYFADRPVAAKTGTTEDNRDAWLIGYTPSIVLGVWNGNNDNSPMKKGSSMAGPMWHEMMQGFFENLPPEDFEPPTIVKNPDLPPAMRGLWQGGQSFFIDKISGKLATELTPPETREEKVVTEIHSILYWLGKESVTNDPQFNNWETRVREWWEQNKFRYSVVSQDAIPKETDDVHVEEKRPAAQIKGLKNIYQRAEVISFTVEATGVYSIDHIDVFFNGDFVGSAKSLPFAFSIDLSDFQNLDSGGEIKAVAVDGVWNRGETRVFVSII